MRRHREAGHLVIVQVLGQRQYEMGETVTIFGLPFRVLRRTDSAEYLREENGPLLYDNASFYEVEVAD